MRPGRGQALLAGLVTLTLLLASCGTDGGLANLVPPTSGQPAQPGAASHGNAGSPGAPSGATATVGTRKVELAAVELDAKCERMVAPFEPSDNIGELLRIVYEQGSATVSDTISTKISGSSAATANAGSKFKRNLSGEVRRSALRMNWLPMSFEVTFGRRELEQAEVLRADSREGRKWYPVAQALLAEVLKGVKEPYVYKFEIYVSTEKGENAMALPGGFIIIDKALLERPELRGKAFFALSHEISHVLERHQTRALQARIIDSLALGASLPDLVKTIHQTHSEPIAVTRLLIGGKLLFEKHSETQELQADSCGVRVLDNAFNDNRRVVAALQSFADTLEKPKARPVKTSTQNASAAQLDNLVDLVKRPVDAHPSTEERIKNLREMLVEIRKRPDAAKPGMPVRPAPSRNVPLPTTL